MELGQLLSKGPEIAFRLEYLVFYFFSLHSDDNDVDNDDIEQYE